MKRHEAVTCLKEINDVCKSMSPDALALVNSRSDDATSTGYQLHIKAIMDNDTKLRVQSIAEKHSLAVKEQDGTVVIYRPKEISKTASMIA